MTTPEPSEQSNFWLDRAADDISARFPEGEIVVSSGISPSAAYHIGHFREIMTAEALAWAVRQRGRAARHIHIVDDFDPLRKWYDFLPPAPRDYAGWPLATVPDPDGDCHESYADHFYAEFRASLEPMGIGGDGFEIRRSYTDLYASGLMAPYIERVINWAERIRGIFRDVSKRDLPADWLPVSYVGDEGRFVKAGLSDWDAAARTVAGRPLDDGRVKLDWRLDWPARWAALGVRVEPFGFQEHGAAGGSYDTGQLFAREVFDIEPPYGEVRYGHIHRPGEPVKMSSSKGNGITPSEALAIMPPEVLRYFIVRGRPENKIFFDPGRGLYDLIDEFSAAQADPEHPFRDAFAFAVTGSSQVAVSTVPFSHLVAVWQAARGDSLQALEILARTGFEMQVKAEAAVITSQFDYVDHWLKSPYAPANVKFAVAETLPDTAFTGGERQFFAGLADRASAGILDGQGMHEAIYAAREAAGLKPAEAFKALYRLILGQDYGPKAGWFLASLDSDWLVSRLRLEA